MALWSSKGLASGGDDHRVRLWAWEGARLAERAPRLRYTGAALAVAFAPGGGVLACGEQAGVCLWDLTRGRPRLSARVETEDDEVGRSLVFSPDGKSLATGGRKHIRLWDLTGPRPERRSTLWGEG